MIEYHGGIDPGKKGGLSLVSHKDLYTIPLPEVRELRDILENWEDQFGSIKHFYIEKAQAFSRDGKAGLFTYAYDAGKLEALMICMRIPYTLITPREWQKEMFKGTKQPKVDKNKDTKKRALEVVQRLYPKQSFLPTIRSKNPHDGMIDSTLIATLCRRQML
jgi:hypothetical protein